jgi:hypothetical protein
VAAGAAAHRNRWREHPDRSGRGGRAARIRLFFDDWTPQRIAVWAVNLVVLALVGLAVGYVLGHRRTLAVLGGLAVPVRSGLRPGSYPATCGT